MPRKTNKTSRKRREESEPINVKEDLRQKLRQKLKEKQIARLSYSARENKLEALEDRLEEVKDHKQRQKIEEQIALLEKVREDELNANIGEYPDYGDNAGYGGSMERPD